MLRPQQEGRFAYAVRIEKISSRDHDEREELSPLVWRTIIRAVRMNSQSYKIDIIESRAI
jgi:hypothetical protein